MRLQEWDTRKGTSVEKRCAQNMINRHNPNNQCNREGLYDHSTRVRIIFHFCLRKQTRDIHWYNSLKPQCKIAHHHHPPRTQSRVSWSYKGVGCAGKGNHLRPSLFTLHLGMEPNARAWKLMGLLKLKRRRRYLTTSLWSFPWDANYKTTAQSTNYKEYYIANTYTPGW